MPKYFITIMALVLVAVGFVVVMMLNVQIKDNEIKAFNAQFEIFNKNRLTGADVVSAINKAINNNKKEDAEVNNIDINVRIIDYGQEVTVNMEKIYSLGIDNFIKYYGGYEFRCTGIEYDENTKKINMLNFENI